MEFIKEGSTLPIPLNLIPSVHGLYNLFKYVIKFFKDTDDDQNEDLQMKTGVFLYIFFFKYLLLNITY
jgi:hypothetical protein